MYLVKNLCKNRDQCTEIQLCRTGSLAIEISLSYFHITANFVIKGLKTRKTLQFLTDSNSNWGPAISILSIHCQWKKQAHCYYRLTIMFRILKERVSWQQLNITPHRFIRYVTLVSANHTGEPLGGIVMCISNNISTLSSKYYMHITLSE